MAISTTTITNSQISHLDRPRGLTAGAIGAATGVCTTGCQPAVWLVDVSAGGPTGGGAACVGGVGGTCPGALTGVPQAPQNFVDSLSKVPQSGQCRLVAAVSLSPFCRLPHTPQKTADSGSAAPHRLQVLFKGTFSTLGMNYRLGCSGFQALLLACLIMSGRSLRLRTAR